MDVILCEADSSTTPTTQDEPPSPDGHIQEDLSIKVDDTTVSEDYVNKEENPSFPTITLEMFENQFKQLLNGEDEGDCQHEELAFRGYTAKEEDFFSQYTDKKSEIMYDLCMKGVSNLKKSILKSAKGRISVPISSKSMNAYLISPKFLPKPVPNVPGKANSAGKRQKRDFKKKKAKQSKPKVTSDVLENVDSSLTLIKSPSASSAPVRAPRLIQTPKRYLDGEEGRPKIVKRVCRRKATESLFEIGLLHPKYPKKMETSSPGNGHIDNDMVSQKKTKQTSDFVNGDENSMFAISNMLNSGELQYVINLHNLEMQHKEKLEQLESKLRSLPKTGIPTPNQFQSAHESRHFDPSYQTLAMDRPAPSSSNVLTIVPLKLSKQSASPPPALVPIQRSSPESIGKRSEPVVTITRAKPKALQTSFKAAGNTTQGNVGNSSKDHMHPPMYSKILPRIPVGSVGPFPDPPILTGKTFKKSPQQPNRQERGSLQNRTFIPDFMMNFLGLKYGLSSTSEAERRLMTPSRSSLWHPDLGELTKCTIADVYQRMKSFLTKCPV